jgi:hypothetical protein
MPTQTYELIGSANGNGSSDSLTFSSIPATYTDLVLVAKVKNASGGQLGTLLLFNGDTTTANYSGTRVNKNNTLDDERDTSGQYIVNQTSSEFAIAVVNIMNYSSTLIRKSQIGTSTFNYSSGAFMRFQTGVWRNTAAIYSVTLLNQNSTPWSTDSTVNLYGIKAY